MRRPFVVAPDWESRLRPVLTALDPAWADAPLHPLGAGMDVCVFALDPDAGPPLTVRCPRHDEAAANARMQRRALPELARRLPVAAPVPVAAAGNPLGPGELDVFVRVPGEVLADEEWQRRGLLGAANAATVAAIIDALAATPVAAARGWGVPDHDLRGGVIARGQRLVTDVAPLLPADEAAAITSWWQRFLADEDNFANEERVIHADISLDHLLVDDGAIVGLIDFGDLAIGDPDYELCYLYNDAGAEFVAEVQRCRGRTLTDRLAAKLRFFELNDLVFDALWAIDDDDRALLDTTLTGLADLTRTCSE